MQKIVASYCPFVFCRILWNPKMCVRTDKVLRKLIQYTVVSPHTHIRSKTFIKFIVLYNKCCITTKEMGSGDEHNSGANADQLLQLLHLRLRIYQLILRLLQHLNVIRQLINQNHNSSKRM